MKTIGFIGLGHMGNPMVKNLLKNNYSVKVFDVSEKAITDLISFGAIAATSPADIAENSDVVFTMLQTGDQVKQCCLSENGIFTHLNKKALYIDSSSIDINSSRELHEKAKLHHIAMLDAPVSGGMLAAQNATLTFMVGGDENNYERAKPFLSAMGKKIIYAGSAGSGACAKICNNMILGVSMIAVCEAFVLADQLGLDPQKLFEISSNASGQCWSLTQYCPWPNILPNVPSSHHYQPGFTAKMMLKDLHLSQDAADTANIETPLGKHATQLYEQFVKLNIADIDFSGIIQMLSLENKKQIFNTHRNNLYLLRHISITDQNQYQELLENILQSTPDAMLIVNQDGNIIYVNFQSEKIFGYNQDELLGTSVEILIPESYRIRHAQHVKNYFLMPKTRPMGTGLKIYAQRKNKEIFPVEISLSPIVLENNLISLAAIRDISERKKAEEKIDQLNKQLLNSAKRAGMAEVSNSILHNIGNVLNSAMISASILRNQTDQSDFVKKLKQIMDLINENLSKSNDYFIKDSKGKLIPDYLKKMVEEIEKNYGTMHQEINNVNKHLNVAIDVILKQKRASESSVFLELASVEEILNFSIKTAECENTGITINKNIDNTLLIYTDKIKLMQILTCIIVNAKESILASSNPNKFIEISIKNDHEKIDIFIKDSGEGISEENLKHLFSFGFSTKKNHCGFGLHNSFLLVKELEGSLCAKSDGKNKGATFILSIPLKNDGNTDQIGYQRL